MRVLGLDFGSSAVKGAILEKGKIRGRVVRQAFPTRYDGVRAEVDARQILRAMTVVIKSLGPLVKRVDAIALSVMSPAWVAMDHEGRAITPIVTHQDRRSIEIAQSLQKRLGKARYLKLAGNLPVPGGISCTTWAWFLEHEAALMKKADLCGHLNTFLHRQLTHARVIDPSNASFTGLYATVTQKGWNDDLLDAAGIGEHALPQIIGSDGIGGLVARSAGSEFGLLHGTPVLAGCVDTSAAMILAGARAGQMVNVCGSTDVLALCVNKTVPDESLLLRALGVGKKWVTVATIAAAGASLDWAKRELFADWNEQKFWREVVKIAVCRLPIADCGMPELRFEPYLAGARVGIEQRKGAFVGMTLATTREDLLGAIIDGLAQASAERIKLLGSQRTQIMSNVLVSGGVGRIGKVMQRDWPGKWSFRQEEEATLRGLALLTPD